MNDIITTPASELPDNMLMQMVQEQDVRKQQFSTDEGKKAARDEIVKRFGYLVACGYQLPRDVDPKFMASVWTETLSEYIVTYGFYIFREAILEFVRTDARDYKKFPTVSDIIAIMKKNGINPKAELSRREHERRVKEIEEEHREEMKKIMTPEHIAYLEKRWGHLRDSVEGKQKEKQM